MLGGLRGNHKRQRSRPKRLQANCMVVCVGRPVWGESDTKNRKRSRARKKVRCVSPSLHRLSLVFPLSSPPSRRYTPLAATRTSRERHIFSSKSKKVVLSVLISAETGRMVGRDEGWAGWESGEGGERRNYFWVILSWRYLKLFRVMRPYREWVYVCVDKKNRVVLNLRKSHLKALNFKVSDRCTSLKFWPSCWGLRSDESLKSFMHPQMSTRCT